MQTQAIKEAICHQAVATTPISLTGMKTRSTAPIAEAPSHSRSMTNLGLIRLMACAAPPQARLEGQRARARSDDRGGEACGGVTMRCFPI